MKLFLLADLHLGADCSEWGDHASKRQEDLRKAWDEAVYVAASEDAGAFLVAGDLFSGSQPEGQDLTTVVEGLERLRAKDIPVVLLPGIYDGAFAENAFYNRDLPEGVTAVTWSRTRCLEIPVGDQTLFVHTRAPIPGFETEPVMVDDAVDGDGIHIGLFYEMPSAIAALSSDRSLEGLDLLIQGGRHDFSRSARDGVPVISPGSPVGLSGEDTGPRTWTVVEITDDEVQVHPVNCDTPRVESRTLDVVALELDGPCALARHLRENIEECSLLLLRLVGDVTEPWSDRELDQELNELPFALALTNVMRVVGSGEEPGVLDGFCREIENRRRDAGSEDEAVFDRALRLGLKELRRREESHAD